MRELEQLLDRLSEGRAQRLSLSGLIGGWENLVANIEASYDWSVYEYTNWRFASTSSASSPKVSRPPAGYGSRSRRSTSVSSLRPRSTRASFPACREPCRRATSCTECR